MKVIINGTQITIHNDEQLIIKDKIPTGCYDVVFSKFTGTYLEKREPLKVKEKVYGEHNKKVEKAFNSFSNMNRSMGIILSGEKGIGKSLFVNLIAEKAMKEEIPILIVQSPIPGLVSFLGSITQECVVVFDEFEKNFREDENGDSTQDSLLSMFDGLDNTKKMFVITCNNIDELSRYLVNRPGRFHYHFKLSNPSSEEIREYLVDNVKEEYHFNIEKVIAYSYITNMTYDWLRAICFELNQGYNIDEIFEDLNIESNQYKVFSISITIGGERFSGVSDIRLGSNRHINTWLFGDSSRKEIRIKFDVQDINFKNNSFEIDKDKIIIDNCDFEENEPKIEKVEIELFKETKYYKI